MPKELPIDAQRKILKLEQRVFDLKQELAATKAKCAKHIEEMKVKFDKQPAELEAENRKLKTQPFIMTEERLADLRARKRASIERRRLADNS